VHEIRRILHPTYFSEQSEAAWTWAELMARTFGAELHLLHVLQEPVAVLPESSLAVAPPAVNLPELAESAQHGLERLTAASPGRVTARVVRHGPAAEEIARYASDAGIDMIVMGTHGRTGLAHVLLGSVAEKVVRKACCAVLTVRPTRPPAA
jgi:nucleotide-binding universal stress UspA family protein